MTARWDPAKDPEWDRVSTPSPKSVFRFRRKTTLNGLHPEVTKARGSNAGTWYSGSAYDAATGYSYRHESNSYYGGWRWPDALAAALRAVGQPG